VRRGRKAPPAPPHIDGGGMASSKCGALRPFSLSPLAVGSAAANSSLYILAMYHDYGEFVAMVYGGGGVSHTGCHRPFYSSKK
jgi:hypothetical protein